MERECYEEEVQPYRKMDYKPIMIITHIFVTCSRLSGLFQLHQSRIRKFTPTIDNFFFFLWYIIGIQASSGLVVYVRRLGGGQIAVVHCSYNKNRSSGTHCVVTLFKAKVISRVNVEYQFASFHTVCNFVEKWNAYNVLCVKWKMTIVFELQIQNC